MNHKELKTIIDNFEPFLTGATAKNEKHEAKCCIFVCGEQGAGKTALLTEARNKLRSQVTAATNTAPHRATAPDSTHIFCSFGQEGDGALRLILRQLIDTAGDSGNPDLMAFINAYANSENSSGTMTHTAIRRVMSCCKR